MATEQSGDKVTRLSAEIMLLYRQLECGSITAAALRAENARLRALVRTHMRGAGYSEDVIQHDLEAAFAPPRASLTSEPQKAPETAQRIDRDMNAAPASGSHR